MDSTRQTRTCEVQRRPCVKVPRGRQQIVLPMDEQTYQRLMPDAPALRVFLDQQLREHPELFPPAFREQGYALDLFVFKPCGE